MQPAHLSREQATALREQVQRRATWLGKLIYRCRELEMHEQEPILFAASRAQIAFAYLDRELLRTIISSHGTLKDQDDRKTEECSTAWFAFMVTPSVPDLADVVSEALFDIARLVKSALQ